MTPAIRLATQADLADLRALLERAMAALLSAWLDPAQVRASRAIMGLDTQLIADGTYFLLTIDGVIAGCGGWSRRATLYGGDHSTDLRQPRRLNVATDPARMRAMYTDPMFVRRGVGRAILLACEAAARREGFRAAELMATMAGEPLYRSAGYEEIERLTDSSGGAAVPLVRMRKLL